MMLVAVAVFALWTRTTLWTWTTLTLYISLWFWDEHLVRKLVLTSLLVYLEELNGNLVTLLESSFLNGLESLPVDLADMEQTILAWKYLYEAAIRHD
jgi:hypothetical protein